MILDKQAMFSSDQAITGTANSSNVVDLGAKSTKVPTKSLRCDAAMIGIIVTSDFVTLTTLTITFTTSAAEGMTNEVTHFSVALALAALVKGCKVFLPIPEDALRYARLTYTVGGSNPGSGSGLTAGIMLDHPANG
jgi:hypothetical protein